MGGWTYILLCADGTLYVGVTANLERRMAEHQRGRSPRSYTALRRPVELVWNKRFPRIEQAIVAEKRLKGWSHGKKLALIRGDAYRLAQLSKCVNQTRLTPLRVDGRDPE